jgi:transcriptional regulator with XRE-family HTH domain
MIDAVPTNAEVGRFIKERREELGLSQGKLAELAGVSRNSVAAWEAGTHGISGRHLPKLTLALDVSDPSMLCAADDDGDIGSSGLVRQQATTADTDAREVLYAFLDSPAAAAMDPPISPREIGWLIDHHHVDGGVTPEYYLYTLLAERSRRHRPPSDRPNEASGAANRQGMQRRQVSPRRPTKRP